MINRKKETFLQKINHSNYIVRDHHVHGVRTLPGVTLLDMIYRLSSEYLGTQGIELKKVLFLQPIVTSEYFDKNVFVTFTPADDSWKVTVKSQKVKNGHVIDKKYDDNMECLLFLSETQRSGVRKDVTGFIKNAEHKWDMDEVYGLVRQVEIHHFVFMKTMGTVYQNENEEMMMLGLSELAETHRNKFYAHPAFLDSSTMAGLSFQLSGAQYGMFHGNIPYIPLMIERFRIFRPLPETIYTYTKRPEHIESNTSEPPDLLTTDVLVLDEQGEVLVEFEKLTVKRIREPDLIKKLAQLDLDVEKKEVIHLHMPKQERLQSHERIKREDLPSKDIGKHITSFIVGEIGDILGKSSAEIDIHTGFYDLGLDSSELLGLVSKLEQKFGMELYPTLLFEYSTIKRLSDHFLENYRDVFISINIEKDLPVSNLTVQEEGKNETLYFEPLWIQESRESGGLGHECTHIIFLYHGAWDLKSSIEGVFKSAQVITLESHGESVPQGFQDKFIRVMETMKEQLKKTALTELLVQVVGNWEEEGSFMYALSGLLKTACLENSKVRGQIVAIERLGTQPEDTVINILKDEMETSEKGLVEICYRGEMLERFVKKLCKTTLEGDGEVPYVKDGGVYLITGGLGGLGLLVANHIADQAKVKLVLLGRSGINKEKEEKINALIEKGAEVLYLQVDIGNETELNKAIHTVKEKFGALSGIFHSAGVLQDQFILQKDMDRVKDVLRPKVHGLWNLDQVTREEKLDFFVAFSSVSAVVGNLGQADYACANAFMDVFTVSRAKKVRLSERFGKTITINWPLWREGGMRVDQSMEEILYASTGMKAMPTPEGLNILDKILGQNKPQMVVLFGSENRLNDYIGTFAAKESTEKIKEYNANIKVGKKTETSVVHDEYNPDGIAVIGLAGRYPMAGSIDEFYRNLREGKDCITGFPKERWNNYSFSFDIEEFYRFGGFIDEIDAFDPLFFNISPRQAEMMDPQARVFLETAWAACEDAGFCQDRTAHYYPSSSENSVGVFVGSFWNHYELFGAELTQRGVPTALGVSSASIPNMVSYCLNFHGPSIAVDTMCSSALTAVHLACESIRKSECHYAIAGGVNLVTHPQKYIFLKKAAFLSSDGRCRSFGEGGDGYVPGEGAGAVLLTTLERAKKEGYRIYGVIRGSALNHVGKTSGATVPDPVAQSEVILEALKKAKIDPRTISYVEAHGTGTSLGDPIEIQGLKRAYHQWSQDRKYCAIGSSKSNIGHLEAAAGIAGLTKLLLQFKYQEVFPSLHSENINPYIPFEDTPFYVQHELKKWEQPEIEINGKKSVYPRRAGLSSFGANGSNAHIIVEEYIPTQLEQRAIVINSKGPYIVPLSAKDSESLKNYARNLLNFIKKENESTGILPMSEFLNWLENEISDILSVVIHVNKAEFDLDQDFTEMNVDYIKLVKLHEKMQEKWKVEINQKIIIRSQSVSGLAAQLLEEHGDELQKSFQVLENRTSDRGSEEINLADLAYTLQIGREAMRHRVAFVVKDMDEFIEKLEMYISGQERGFIQGIAQKGYEKPTGFYIEEVYETDADKQSLKLAEQWAQGFDVDWNWFYKEAKPCRISLPTYPFTRERYWIGGPEAARMNKIGDTMEVMTFEEIWEEAAPEAIKGEDFKTIVCFLSDPQNQEVFLKGMKTLSPQTGVVFISQDTYYRKESKEFYFISGSEPNTYLEALEDIRKEWGRVDAVLYLWALEDPESIRDYFKIVYIVKSISASGLKPGRFILGGQFSTGLQRCYLESWIGFERSLGLIMPGLKMASIYREVDNRDRETMMKDWLEKLWFELQVGALQSVLYRDGKRHQLKRKPVSTKRGISPLIQGGTYLITGGCGGLGYLFAEHLVKNYSANLILTGRSPMCGEKELKIKNLEESGGKVIYIRGDVCDNAQMAEGLAKAKERFGKIHGVIHAAGIDANQSILEKDLLSFQEVLAPKIQGTLVLDEVLRGNPPDFICYFSSSSAVLGDFGSCDYAVGNRFQSAYALYRSQEADYPTRRIAIQWPLWKDGGMKVGREEDSQMYLKTSGQRFLEAAEGIRMFEQLLLQDKAAYLVLAGQRDRVLRFLGLEKNPDSKPVLIPSGSSGSARRIEMKALSLEQCIEWDLKEITGELLKISRDKIDMEDPLSDLGFDSISLAQFADLLTKHYGIEITPALFFNYATIRKLIHYLIEEHKETIRAFYKDDGLGQDIFQESLYEEPLPLYWEQGKSGPAVKPSEPKYEEEPIAIIGMSGRFPEARNIDEMWNILKSGLNVVGEIPSDRLGLKYSGGSYQGMFHDYKWYGSIPGPGEFDPLFFEISPREAENMDPRQRLLLQEAWRAMEDAGYGSSHIKKGKIGMFVGVEQGDYQQLVDGNGSITSNHNGILASRLAYFLNFSGPVMAIDTACSSGLVAAHQACLSLRNLECDTAIAAGVTLMFTGGPILAMKQAGMLSEDGKCHAFDKRANGMVPGEAVVALVLKRLSQAKADGDPVYAVIKGSGINYDGKTNGITAPSGSSQTNLLKSLYARYKVNPEEVEYIVTHGTGTKLGDPVEINALYDAFKDYTQREGYCALTSTKTNFGHTLAASGLVSLVGLVQSMRYELIPASLHCMEENDYIHWKRSPFYVNKSNKPWTGERGKVRMGAVSAFGMSGTNAHMVVQSYVPDEEKSAREKAPYYLILLSAKTQEALKEKAQDLIEVLKRGDLQNTLTNISYTLMEGRQHFNCRLAAVVQDWDDAIYALKQVGRNEKVPNLFVKKVPKDFTPQKAIEQCAQDLMAESRNFLFNQERYREILYALAEFYCQGYELTWEKLFGERKPTRVHLPTYPFSRTHYWALENKVPAPMGVGIVPLMKEGAIHPLLHKNTSTFSLQRFSSIFIGEEFFLSDHVIKEQRILPGAACLEMVREAVKQAAGDLDEAKTGIEIRNVVWVNPVAVGDNPLQVHVGLFYEEDGKISYEIYSDPADRDKDRVIYCQGVAVVHSLTEVPGLNIKALQENCSQGILSAKQCYEAFSGMGMEYGLGHRGMEQIYLGQGEVLAKLSLPASVSDTLGGFFLHPSMMDSALQASIGLMLETEKGIIFTSNPMLPFALQRVNIIDRCTSQMWAFVRHSEGSKAGDKVQKIDIDLCDLHGKVCVQIKGFSTRRMENADISREALTSSETLILAPCWKEQEIQKAQKPDFEEHLVFFCELGAISEENIYKKMKRVRYIPLESMKGGMEKRFENHTVKLFEEIRRIFQDMPHGHVLIQVVVPSQYEEMLFSGLAGLLRTAHGENPKLIGQLIEVEPGIEPDSILKVLEENSQSRFSGRIRYQNGLRYVEGWEEINIIQNISPIPWKDGGVYLITGGAGSLGMIFAKEIGAKVKDAALILTGRSVLGEEKQNELNELKDLGVRVQYRQTDITDRREVSDLIQSVLNEFGALHGIIHSAGVIRDNFILKKDIGELKEVLAPKVTGLICLDKESKDLPLDFFAVFSSVAGAMGNPGQADYAAGNAFMDAYAYYRNHLVASKQRQGQTISINWPLWKDGGMRVDQETEKMMLHKTGMMPIQTSSGIWAFYRGLASGRDQIMVAEGNLIRIRQKLLSTADPLIPGPIPSPAHGKDPENSLESVQNTLIQLVSDLLKVEAQDIDTHSELSEYGFDSITFTAFANKLNGEYGLELTPTVFFEHPSIHSLAKYLIKEYGTLFEEKKAEFPVEDEKNKTEEIIIPQEQPIRFSKVKTVPLSKQAVMPQRGPTVPQPIAIVGMSGIFPGARDVNALWDKLVSGESCITEVPKERWDWKAYYGDPVREVNKTNVKWGGFIEGVDEFDPLFFGISPREAQLMDPQQRLMMMYVWKTMEDAGYSAKSLSGTRTAIFVGTGSSAYSGLISRANVPIEGYSSTGMVPSVGPNRMSYFLNIHGPSEPVETACSSSLVAIHRAVCAIWDGSCDKAIAGGVNTILTPELHISFNKAGMLCEDGQCKTFSKEANGYVRSEGAGMIFLKRLEDAERDGDHIYGVIRGTAVNHGGRANSLTSPNPKAQAKLLIDAYTKAGIDPRTVSYIEAHGTGTELGDPIEINGLKTAFKELYQAVGDSGEPKPHCGLGSVKSNIGHLELAAGIAGVIKVLLQLKHKMLVKSLHCDTLNPYIELHGSPFYIVTENREWEALKDPNGRDIPRRAGVSSFGFGGVNAHIIIEEYIPKEKDQSAAPRCNPVIIVLSAKNEERLKAQVQQLLTGIRGRRHSGISLIDMAYTLQGGREAMEERLAVLVESMEELEEKLTAFVENKRGIPNLYLGQTKPHKEAMTVLTSDEDMQEAIDKWTQRKKYNKLLGFWVKGMDFDWRKLYDDPKPRRISLPTYPFAKERYWVPEGKDKTSERPVPLVTKIQDKGLIPQNGPVLSSASHDPKKIMLQPISQYQRIPESAPSGVPQAVQLEPLEVLDIQPHSTAEPKLKALSTERVLPETLHEELKSSLAEALYMNGNDIDIDKAFVDIGLDSIVGVEWIRVINKQYGTALAATSVYDYPTIREFSQFLVKEIHKEGGKRPNRLKTEEADIRPITDAPVPFSAPVDPVQEMVRANEREKTLYPSISLKALEDELRASLAEALYIDPKKVETDRNFVDMGLDSIVGVEWIRMINKQYGLSIGATKIYDYPTIRELAGFLEEELKKQKSVPQEMPLPPLNPLTLDEMLEQVKQGALDVENAQQLLKNLI
ncbi:MAG: SDR family NAD(P)-dependent oxidoreductase [Clostridia bacterium]|nr:SDR family NAD(P)-dependent oxidoreductase [Clostridia bacterium]